MAYKKALSAAADTAGAILSVVNPEGVDVVVRSLILDITTASSGSCTVDCGIGTGATTKYDTLIDGVSVASAGVVSNLKDPGTNGKATVRWPAGQYLTISTASGAIAGAVGSAYVVYDIL